MSLSEMTQRDIEKDEQSLRDILQCMYNAVIYAIYMANC